MKTKTLACCLLSVGVASIAGEASAQATRALPRIVTDGFAGATNFSIPPTAFRAQYWFAGDNLPINSAVTALGIRIARNTAVGASSRTVGIEVANASTSFSSYSATFAQNLGPFPTTSFASRTVNVPASSPSSDPNVAAAWFPGDAPFPCFGPHLVVDFRGGASSGSAVVPNDGFVGPPGGATLGLPAVLSFVFTPSITSQVVHPRIPNPQRVQDFATTNTVTSALGFAGACNALFAGSDTATTATQGPQPINDSIGLLVR